MAIGSQGNDRQNVFAFVRASEKFQEGEVETEIFRPQLIHATGSKRLVTWMPQPENVCSV